MIPVISSGASRGTDFAWLQFGIDQARRAHVGHIGSAFSIVEILAAIYGDVLRATGAGRGATFRISLPRL